MKIQDIKVNIKVISPINDDEIGGNVGCGIFFVFNFKNGDDFNNIYKGDPVVKYKKINFN